MVRVYIEILDQPNEKVKDEIFNVGFENYTLDEIGWLEKIGKDIIINHEETNDNRSYHISSQKILNHLEFKPEFSIEQAIEDLKKPLKKIY